MPEKKRCNTNCQDDIVRFSGIELWKRVPKQEFIRNQGEDEEVADGLSEKSSIFPKDGFPQLCEQGDNISQIK